MSMHRRLLCLLTALCLLMTPLFGALAEAEAPEDAVDEADVYESESAEGDPNAENWAQSMEGAQIASAATAEGVEIYFLDLGRVDGILIRCDGETAFIDVGERENAPGALDYLKYLGVTQLDYYIGTHAHADHVGGASRIIHAFKPRIIYMNRPECMDTILEFAKPDEAESVRQAQSIILNAGDTFNIGSAVMRCIGPIRLRSCNKDATKENNNSLILRLEYNGRRVLFTGDTMDAVLREVESTSPGALKADVWKNPHHNGKHDEDVVRMVSPSITVVSTSNDHLPVSKYTTMLGALGSECYITGSAKRGNVVITIKGDTIGTRFGYPMTSIRTDPIPTLYVGQKITPVGSAEPAERAKADWIAWSSSDPGVIRVRGNVLEAVGPGTATVTASTFNGLESSQEVSVFTALVEADRHTLKLKVGEKAKLRAKIYPESNPHGVTGAWRSADESILGAKTTGEVMGVAEGTTQAIAELSNGASDAVDVVVEGYLIEGIRISKEKAKLKVGETLSLSAKVKPESMSYVRLEWASSDESVLWVDMDGNVTAVGKGKAKIGVRVPGGKFATCTITVR